MPKPCNHLQLFSITNRIAVMVSDTVIYKIRQNDNSIERANKHHIQEVGIAQSMNCSLEVSQIIIGS